MLLASVLSRFIRIGRLTLIDAAGRRHVFEGGPGPAATVRLHDPALHRKLLASPRLCVPEAYMDGTLTIEEGSLYDFIDVLTANDAALDESLPMRDGGGGKASRAPAAPIQPGAAVAAQRGASLRSVGPAL